MLEVLFGESAGAAGADERIDAEAEVKSGERRFREPGQLEEKHVPTATALAAIGPEVAEHDAGVRDVENGELGDAVGMEDGSAPGDGSAPVVASEEETVCAELIGDGDDVGGEERERVGGGAAGFGGFVVAALIGNDDAKTGGGKRRDLAMPGIPKFGKAVEEDDDGSALRAGGDDVEVDCAVFKDQVFEGGRHEPRVYAKNGLSNGFRRLSSGSSLVILSFKRLDSAEITVLR